jgi:putative tricarboxylic transport membrane protein
VPAGFWLAFQPLNLFLAFAGAMTGTVVGMLPGIGPINAIAILIPFCFSTGLPPESVLILLTTIYYGSQYGNSISTILLNVPGTASATVTALDGYALTRKGRAASALAMAAVSSFVGGMLSLVGLALFAPALSSVAVRFGPAEYFALMVFALSTLTSLSGASATRGVVSALLGLGLSTIGFDPNSAVARYSFGELRLLDGIDFVVLTIGLFAMSEVLLALEKPDALSKLPSAVARSVFELREWLACLGTMIRGTVVGFLVGVLPGAGGTVASFVAYTTEERFHPGKKFGEGELEGVAAPEAANNAAATGAMIPLLTLGVPGSGTTAVLLGALLGLDIAPGPLFLENHGEVFWALVASMVVGNVVLLILNLPLVSWFARILSVPSWFLYPGIVVTSVVAAYAVNGATFDVVLMLGFGVLGYLLRKSGFPLAPVVLGFVLGALMEKSLRRAMALSGGGWEILFSSPLAIGIWVLALAMLALPLLRRRRT